MLGHMQDTAIATVNPHAAQLAAFNALPMRERVASVVADMVREFGTDSTPPVDITFCNGMCMIAMLIPKGMYLVGRIHRAECLNFCSYGDIDIFTEAGVMRVGGGFVAESAPMTQKIGFAYQETLWINVFKTNCTDVARIKDELSLTLEETIDFLDPDRKYFTKELTSCH